MAIKGSNCAHLHSLNMIAALGFEQNYSKIMSQVKLVALDTDEMVGFVS